MATLCLRVRKTLSLLRPTVRFHSIQPRWRVRNRRLLIAFGGGLAGASSLAFISSPTRLETLSQQHDERSNTSDESLLRLLRAYAVYTACAIPSLIDSSPRIFSIVQSIPVMRQISGLIVEYTFFDQVGTARCSGLVCNILTYRGVE